MTQFRRAGIIAMAMLAIALSADAASKRPPQKLVLRFPRFTIPAGANVGACVFVRLPLDTPFDLASFRILHRGVARGPGPTVVHFLVHLYQGENLAGFGQGGEVIFDRGCSELGPVDRHTRQLIASGAAAKSSGRFPTGLAMPLLAVPEAPGGSTSGVGVLLDANWLNTGSKDRRVSSRVVLERAKPGTVRRRLESFIARDAEAGIEVPPFSVGTTEAIDARWRPPGYACLYDITTHMHRRGVFVGVDVLDAAGQVRNPDPTFPNPFEIGRTHFFSAPDWTDPGSRRFPGGFLVRSDESLRFACRHDNGASLPARLGCEERAGEPPGGLGTGPAKPCERPTLAAPECPAADAAYPGRAFTGACVPATLVAGNGGDDEACAITGLYYGAVAGASSEAACDIGTLPALP